MMTRRSALKLISGFAAAICARNLPSLPTLDEAVEQKIIPQEEVEAVRSCLTPEQIEAYFKDDCDRIMDRIAQVLALNSPWLDIIENGIPARKERLFHE